MRFTTIVDGQGTAAARVEGDSVVPLAFPDVAALLAAPDWQSAPDAGPGRALSEVVLAPLVRPAKVICVGLNYRSHILEMGRDLPTYPTLFAKYADTLTAPYADISLPQVSDQVDWEVELGVVVGRTLRDASPDEAREAIAGYTVVNDVSMRDWQWRTTQWFAGKNFTESTPVGPVLVTPDEIDHARDLQISCEVDGAPMQKGTTSDLLFDPAFVVSYISQVTTLRPGDLIATGTPGGVAAGRPDKPFLRDGQVVKVEIEGIGACVNTFRREAR
jgi:acylpyruvate hydrolase